MQAVAERLLADITNGMTLSDAMQKHPAIFPADYLSLVRAGEIGGRTEEVLEELADLLERRIEVQGKLRSSLVYPTILIALALASLGVIIGGLVPSIAPIFAGSGKPMPAGIRFLVTLHAVWPQLLTGLLVVATLSTALGMVALRRPGVRLAFDRLQ